MMRVVLVVVAAIGCSARPIAPAVRPQAVQLLELRLVTIGPPVGMGVGDALRCTSDPDDISHNTWGVQIEAADLEAPERGLFVVRDGIAETAQSIVRAFNRKSTNTRLRAEYLQAGAPGHFRISTRAPGEEPFTCIGLAAFGGGGAGVMFGQSFAPSLPTGSEIESINRVDETVTVHTWVPHGFRAGQTVELVVSNKPPVFPNGAKTVASTPTQTSFTYIEPGPPSDDASSGGWILNAPASSLVSVAGAR